MTVDSSRSVGELPSSERAFTVPRVSWRTVNKPTSISKYSFMNSQHSPYLQLAINLSREVGSILLGLRGHAHADLKEDGTLVSIADTEAERHICDKILHEFPEDTVLSEELNTVCQSNSGAQWVVDPLDGTTNYIHGLPLWGVSIARILGGRPDLGVIYFPVLDELYHAIRHGGAFENHHPIGVSAQEEMDAHQIFSCCNRTLQSYSVNVACKMRVLGSATYGMCSIARGRSLAGMESESRIWDLAAAWLLVEEAGGSVRTLDGSTPFPLMRGHDYSGTSFPLIAAANPELLEKTKSSVKRVNSGQHQVFAAS